MSKSLVNGKGDGLDEPVPFKTVLGLENVDNIADVNKSFVSDQISDATDDGDANPEKILKTNASGGVEVTQIFAQQIYGSNPGGGPPNTPTFPLGIAASGSPGVCSLPAYACDLAGFVAVPASASATGITGQIAYDGSFFYVCTATDTWVRAALATW